MEGNSTTRGVQTLNTIRALASESYKERVPLATDQNILEVGNPILQYQSVQNEFLDLMVNKIAFSIIQSRIIENPLANLKKGRVPLGSDIEDLFVNPAKAKTYDPDGKNLLQREIPDVKAVYYRMNRQDRYKVTISNDQLALAFTSYAELERLIAGIVNSLYSGDNNDEFLLMKNLVNTAYDNKYVNTNVINAVTDETTAKNLVRTIIATSSKMKFPSSDYNSYEAYATAQGLTNVTPVITQTPIQNQVLLVTADVLSYINVDVLAAAFNMSRTEFMGRVIEVDKFDDDGVIQAILCDDAFFQVWDNREQMTNFYNGEGLYWQYMWHHWQTYAISPFANAVIFATKEAEAITAPTSLTLHSPASLDLEPGDTSNIAVTATGTGNSVDQHVKFTSSDTSVARVSKGGRITAKAEGDAVITIQAVMPKSGTGTSGDPYTYAKTTVNVNVVQN